MNDVMTFEINLIKVPDSECFGRSLKLLEEGLRDANL